MVNKHIVALPNDRYVALSDAAFTLYRAFEEGRSSEDVARDFCSTSGGEVTVDQVEAARRELHEKLEKAAAAPAAPRLFLFAVPLIPARIVDALSARLVFAYSARPALVLCAAIVSALVAGVASGALSFHMVSPRSAWMWGYALYLASVIVHEFGHASASKAFGVRPKEIGLTNYFVFPALYSDVSGVWILNRWQRLIVDLGGTYFQFVCLAAYVALGILTHDGAFAIAAMMIVLSSFFNLNPILRFDGYWALADALEAPNLAALPLKLLREIVKRRSLDVGWSRAKTAVVLAYGAFTTAAWLYFIMLGIGFVAVRGPRMLMTLVAQGLAGRLSTGGLASAVLTAGSLVITVWGFSRLAMVLWKRLPRRRTQRGAVS